MSLTPPDEAGGSDPSSGDADEDTANGSGFGRAVDRVTGACRTVGRALRRGLVALLDAPSRPAELDVAPEERDTGTRTDSTSEYALVADDGDADDGGDSVASPPVVSTTDATDTAIVEHDREEPDVDRLELEVQWHGDAVTFVSPEEPDAHITSDVWEDLER